MSRSRFAILLDGAFVIKKLEHRLGRFPSAADIERLCLSFAQFQDLRHRELLRIYFYHAPPTESVLINPIDKCRINLGRSQIHAQHTSLLETLELHPNFALRLGETVVHEWRLGSRAIKSLNSGARMIEARDLIPNISQKGVDLRIGLDIYSYSRLATLPSTTTTTMRGTEIVTPRGHRNAAKACSAFSNHNQLMFEDRPRPVLPHACGLRRR